MILTCIPTSLTAPRAPDALTLQRVDAYSGRDALAELVTAGPGLAVRTEGGDPTAADVAVLVALLGDGLGVLARVGTTPAGGSFFGTPVAGAAHLAPVGIAPERRGDGLEAVVAGELARLAFRMGAERALLEVEPEDAERYAAAGFRPA